MTRNLLVTLVVLAVVATLVCGARYVDRSIVAHLPRPIGPAQIAAERDAAGKWLVLTVVSGTTALGMLVCLIVTRQRRAAKPRGFEVLSDTSSGDVRRL
jgi:hypothetical protein